MRPDGDATGGDDQVGLEGTLERAPVRALVVRDRREHLDGGARRHELSREHRPVGLVDLPRPERLSGRAELGSGGQNGGARTLRRAHSRETGGSDGSHLGGGEAYARRGDHRARGDITSARTDVRTGGNGIGNLHCRCHDRQHTLWG